MPYQPSPEKLSSLGYSLHRRKKIGDYYAHDSCRGGSGAVGYSIGLRPDGTVVLWSYLRNGPRFTGLIASEDEFDALLQRHTFPIQP